MSTHEAGGMLNAIARLAAVIGPVDTAFYGVARMLSKLSLRRARLLKYYIMAQPVPSDEFTPPGRGRAIVVSEGNPEEAFEVPFGRPAEVIRRRLECGSRYLVARKGSEVLGFQWFTLQDYPEDEVRCLFRLNPRDRCAWDFDVYVRPEARFQPVFTRLWDTCNAILRTAGIDYSLSRIDALNPVSRSAHRRLGAMPVGWCVFLVAGRAQLSFFSFRPWVHCSLFGGTAPELAVSALAPLREGKTA